MRGARFLDVSDVVRVGAWYGHTIGERLEALEQIKQGFDQLYSEMGIKIGTLPVEGSAERVKTRPAPWFAWWQSVFIPVIDRWRHFYLSQIPEGYTGPAPSYVAYGERASTNWDVYKEWRDQLVTLRESAAEITGKKLISPPPAHLNTTPVEDIGNAVKHGADELGKIGKTILYGGLALGGALAVVEIVNVARGK